MLRPVINSTKLLIAEGVGVGSGGRMSCFTGFQLLKQARVAPKALFGTHLDNEWTVNWTVRKIQSGHEKRAHDSGMRFALAVLPSQADQPPCRGQKRLPLVRWRTGGEAGWALRLIRDALHDPGQPDVTARRCFRPLSLVNRQEQIFQEEQLSSAPQS
jgi:hypothetical protein